MILHAELADIDRKMMIKPISKRTEIQIFTSANSECNVNMFSPLSKILQ